MNLVHAVSIGITGTLTFSMVDRDMHVAPGRETGIHAVLVGVDGAALLDRRGDPGSNGCLLHVAAQSKEALSTSGDHAQDWGLVCCRCPTPAFPFPPSMPSYPPFSWSDQRS